MTKQNPLDAVAAALHQLHLEKPAAYVWEVVDRAELILDKEDVNPHFANQLIPLYTRDQLYALLGEE
jgi:hypothetical protein